MATDRLAGWALISRAGRAPRIWLAYACALSLSGAASRRAARHGVAAMLLTDRLVTLLLKPLFGRARPADISPAAGPLTDPSFPSAHAANGFAFATAAGRTLGTGGTAAYLAAGAIAASRVALRAHHLTDVVAGAALGALIGGATAGARPRDPAVVRHGR
ncbi:MAG: phosphatase PAP2 family protein [Solirubrobacterales bacterium]|nr:phosphatase PAP2 family protein [Solirubrobacterales bacterium]